MFKTLLEKMLTSRKFVVMLVGFLIKALTPLAVKYGVDINPINDALTQYTPVIITWLIGQSAVDVVNSNKLASELPTENPNGSKV